MRPLGNIKDPCILEDKYDFCGCKHDSGGKAISRRQARREIQEQLDDMEDERYHQIHGDNKESSS